MDQVKHWLASKTVWGGAITALASAAAMAGQFLGFSVDAAAVSEARTALEAISDNLVNIITLGGGLIAIWGRIVAKKVIG